MFKNTRKDDLINLLNELSIENTENETVVQLKTKIENSQYYKDDPAMVADLLASIVEDRKSKAQLEAQKMELESQKLELERVKLAQLEKQLEIEKTKNLNSKSEEQSSIRNEVSNESNLEHLIKSVRTLTIPVPEESENVNLFFQTLERAFTLKNVPDTLKSEILINLLADKLTNILSYISDEDLKSYDTMKNIILKEYQPTALECLHKFRRAQKENKETYIQFASRLNALFRYYLKLRNVNDFETLCDLIVSDKLFQTLDRETSSYISIKQGDSWMKFKDCAKECDIFHVNSKKSISDTHSFIQKRNVENKSPAKFLKDNSQYRKLPFRNREKQISCYICSQNHYARECPNRNLEKKKEIKQFENVSANSIGNAKNSDFSTDPFFNKLEYVDIFVDNIPLKGLKDSGSSLLVVNRNVIPHPKTIISQTTIISCFNEKRNVDIAKFMISLPNSESCLEVTGAICNSLSCDVILPSILVDYLQKQKKEKVLLPVSLAVNPSEDKISFEKKNCFYSLFDENAHESNICFLSKLCNAVDECKYDLSHLSDRALKNKLNDLIINYKPNKTESTNLKMSIILTDDIPVCQRARRLSYVEKIEVEKQIQQWLKEGVIQESCSDYCSPIVVCRKKNGEMRLCVDYRQINKKTIKDKYPLPIIEELLDKLGNGKIFTTLDLKNAFLHVDVDEKSRKYTSFVTDNAQYEFLKVPFGLSNSPLIFQRYVNNVFKELLKDGTVIIYLDDIIIPAMDENEGLEKLKRVLETASKFGLELNLKKCQFMQKKISFLGHVIENGTIKPSVEKTLAVQKFPEPRNVREVQSFLGLTGYFRKYIHHYATIARPLSDLLRASMPFKFEQEQKLAFQTLKDILCSEPVLHLFKQGAKLELHTDASSLGFGAILLQESDDGKFYPLHYMSRKTSVQEEKYCSYELEVLAVITALKKFRNYLLGTKFKVYTDCKAFTETLNKKDLSPKVARWALLLQEFEIDVEHRSGKQMQHVDALSRHPVMMITTDELTHKIFTAQEEDEYIKTMKNLLQQGQNDEYVLKNKILFKIVNDQDVLVVPEKMQAEVVRKSHSLGHFSIAKTEELIKRDYYFPKMRKCIEGVVNNCVECILINKKRGKGEGFLNPIPKEDIPLSTYHVDFVGPLPTTNKNYNHIFTVIDAFTKFSWLYPVKNTTADVAILKLKQQQAIFGNPARIVSDKGPAFTSKEFQDYCKFESIDYVPITTGVPRGNGQVERLNATIIPVLSKLSIEEPNKWYKHVDTVQRIINSTTSRSTKRAPFELLTGLKMRNREEKRILEILEEERIKLRSEHLNTIREEAKKNILKIQEENRRCYNRKRKKAHQYKVNDLVAIQRTQFGSGLKLRPKFHGPYKVVRVKPHDRYDVEKIGQHEGPIRTSTSADHMKLWDSV